VFNSAIGLGVISASIPKEGANVAIGYYNEHQDAKDTVRRLEELGVKAKAYAHDLYSSGMSL
jgi:superfamily II DNA helicase RecQ